MLFRAVPGRQPFFAETVGAKERYVAHAVHRVRRSQGRIQEGPAPPLPCGWLYRRLTGGTGYKEKHALFSHERQYRKNRKKSN